MNRIALGAAGLVVALASVIALRQATMSVHHPAPPGSSTTVVVSASTKNREPTTSVVAMARAHIALCRLEVHDETVVPELQPLQGGAFEFRLEPALDDSDLRQLHGCLEDALIDHLQLTVERMEIHEGGMSREIPSLDG